MLPIKDDLRHVRILVQTYLNYPTTITGERHSRAAEVFPEAEQEHIPLPLMIDGFMAK